jgi:pimeloyl-ACP methyl ester carboxylesterase
VNVSWGMRRWLASVSVILAMVGGPLVLPSSAGPTDSRPYALKVPAGYDARHPAPLVVLLHGYTSNGDTQARYFGLPALADTAGFLLATPNGTRDLFGNRFWNGTDACCDWFRTGVDDVAYIDAVIDEIAAGHSVDPARVFVVGHSNGAPAVWRPSSPWPASSGRTRPTAARRRRCPSSRSTAATTAR